MKTLSLARPSWVWACAANTSDAYAYEEFLDAVAKLPDAELLEGWLGAQHDLRHATRASARQQLERAYEQVGARPAASGDQLVSARLSANYACWARRLRWLMDKPRAAVIGSGFGGLAAAIRLQAAGCDTVIFEKRDQPGGRAYVYRDNGFTFDAGPTVITAPHCLEELFAVAGKSMQRLRRTAAGPSVLPFVLG